MKSDDDAPAGGVHLIYQYFRVNSDVINEKQAAFRQGEYDECLYRNLQHPHVKCVHVMLENETDENQLKAFLARLDSYLTQPQKSKIVHNMLGRRMHYSDAFEYANHKLTGEICVILNGDMFLGEGVDAVLGRIDDLFRNGPVALSLTRHEKGICKHRDADISDQEANQSYCGCPFMKRGYAGSHDSFWFLAPIAKGIMDQTRHYPNRWGAEHSVINALLKNGYRVLNPSRSVRTYHVHDSDLHPWRKEPGGDQILADPRDHIPLPPTIL